MEPKTHCMRHCAQKSTENDADRQSFGHIRRINYNVEKIRQLTWVKTNSIDMTENFMIFLLGVKENRWLHNSQNSFLEYFSHWSKHSWWIYLILPVQIQGWNNGLSGVPSHRQTRQMSPWKKTSCHEKIEFLKIINCTLIGLFIFLSV